MIRLPEFRRGSAIEEETTTKELLIKRRR